MEESADSKELLVDIDLDLTAQVVLFLVVSFIRLDNEHTYTFDCFIGRLVSRGALSVQQLLAASLKTISYFNIKIK